jgi:hypothetical protein
MGGFEAIFLPSAIEDIEEGSFDSDCVGTRFKTVYAETEEVAELVRKSGFNGNIMPLDYGGFTYYYRRSFLPWSYYNADMGS